MSNSFILSAARVTSLAVCSYSRMSKGCLDTTGVVDGGAAAARFDVPRGLVSDAAGNLYAADWRQHTIRKITRNGDVSTFVGVAGREGSADGVGAEARFNYPDALAFGANGDLYVADSGNHTIRRITPAGVVTTVAGAAGQRGSSDGAAASARFDSPQGLAFDATGNLFVADTSNRTIRRISSAGVVTTVAGRAGLATGEFVDGAAGEARFRAPRSLAIDSAGRLYVCDDYVAVRRITPAGEVTMIHGHFSSVRPIAVNTGRGDGLGTGPTILSSLAVDRSDVIYVSGFGGMLRIVEGGAALTLPLNYKHPVFGHDVSIWNATGLGVAPDGSFHVADETRIYRSTLVPGGTNSLVENVTAPRAQTVPSGESVAFAVEASGPGLCYQWFKDGVGLPGATSATLFLTQVGVADTGRYSVLVGNGAGVFVSAPAELALGSAAEPARLVNLSIRSASGAGAQALTVGLVLAGGEAAARKNLLVRGIGPTLTDFGVGNNERPHAHARAVRRDPRGE